MTTRDGIANEKAFNALTLNGRRSRLSSIAVYLDPSNLCTSTTNVCRLAPNNIYPVAAVGSTTISSRATIPQGPNAGCRLSRGAAAILERLERFGVCAVMPSLHCNIDGKRKIENLRRNIFNSKRSLAEHYIHNNNCRRHTLLDFDAASQVANYFTPDIVEAIEMYSLRLAEGEVEVADGSRRAGAGANAPQRWLRMVEAAAIHTSYGAAEQPVHRDVDTVTSRVARISRPPFLRTDYFAQRPVTTPRNHFVFR